MIVPWINEWINWIFQWFKLKNHQYSRNFRVWEKVEIYHNRWSMSVLWERCNWNLQMTNTPFHVIPAYSEYISEWKLHCCSGGPELTIRTCYRETLKHYYYKKWTCGCVTMSLLPRSWCSWCVCFLTATEWNGRLTWLWTVWAKPWPPCTTTWERSSFPHTDRYAAFLLPTASSWKTVWNLLTWKVRNSDAPYYMLKLKNKLLCMKAKTPHTFFHNS